ARIRKCPAISYLVVAMYPLVPGSGLYRALTYARQGESPLFLSTALRAIAVAGCLAAGMVAVSSLVRRHGAFANPGQGRSKTRDSDTILLDADMTLFDFDRSEHEALCRVLNARGCPTDKETTDAYVRINWALWDDYAKGRVTQEEIGPRRFQALF